jgi:hypothetical protein
MVFEDGESFVVRDANGIALTRFTYTTRHGLDTATWKLLDRDEARRFAHAFVRWAREEAERRLGVRS